MLLILVYPFIKHFSRGVQEIGPCHCIVTAMKLGFLNGMRCLSHWPDEINHSNVHFMLHEVEMWYSELWCSNMQRD